MKTKRINNFSKCEVPSREKDRPGLRLEKWIINTRVRVPIHNQNPYGSDSLPNSENSDSRSLSGLVTPKLTLRELTLRKLTDSDSIELISETAASGSGEESKNNETNVTQREDPKSDQAHSNTSLSGKPKLTRKRRMNLGFNSKENDSANHSETASRNDENEKRKPYDSGVSPQRNNLNLNISNVYKSLSGSKSSKNEREFNTLDTRDSHCEENDMNTNQDLSETSRVSQSAGEKNNETREKSNQDKPNETEVIQVKTLGNSTHPSQENLLGSHTETASRNEKRNLNSSRVSPRSNDGDLNIPTGHMSFPGAKSSEIEGSFNNLNPYATNTNEGFFEFDNFQDENIRKNNVAKMPIKHSSLDSITGLNGHPFDRMPSDTASPVNLQEEKIPKKEKETCSCVIQ